MISQVKPDAQVKRRPIWVSHNKVLIGNGDGNKKPHARNPNFDGEETRLLISLWGDPQVQRTLITIHKKHPVIAKIAERMRSHGYNRSTEEINTRIKNLKCLYNRIKKDLDSGLLNEPSWKHYAAMDEILSRPVFGNSNKVQGMNKIVISPSQTSLKTSPPPLEGPFASGQFQVKEEDLSDREFDDESMDFEGSELRPEDLLSVIDDEENEVQIKDEPMDVETVIKLAGEKETPDSSTTTETPTDPPAKETPAQNPQAMTKSIINYTTDSLSIASVSGNSPAIQTIPISPKTSQQQQSANKISLVPTKLLLKPPQSTTTFKPSSTIVYSSVPSSTSSGTVTTNAQSSLPMKLVFVNALNNNANAQQSGQKPQQLTINNKSLAQLQQSQNSAFLTNKLLSAGQGQKVQIVQTPFNSVRPKVATAVVNDKETSNGGKGSKLLGSKLPVIRNLLTNIVEIENQRLEIEKQRFEYEKTVGNELLSMLRTFISNHSKPEESAEEKPSVG